LGEHQIEFRVKFEGRDSHSESPRSIRGAPHNMVMPIQGVLAMEQGEIFIIFVKIYKSSPQ
jgi:hypothetical protein